MEALLLIALGGVAVWVFMNLKAAAERSSKWERLASEASYSEAGLRFQEVCEIIKEHFREGKNSKYTSSQITDMIECAVSCKNRMNELMGEEHGPAFRSKFRSGLIARLATTKDVITD